MSNPNPRHLAYAISDHAAPRVREAWRYLDSWSSLRASGVPALQLRHVLDLEARETEARRVVDEWEHLGARGLLALVGAQDCGKSDAATRWALRRHRAGLSTMWIHAVTWGRLGFGSSGEPNEIAALLRKAETADALVIDDVGAGDTQGELFRKKMRGLILEREQRPTVITGNLNESHLYEWVGERIESRLHETGRIKHIGRSLQLRKDDGNDDKHGRPPAWFAARKMVDYFGCERVDRAIVRTVEPEDGPAYEEPTGEYEDGLDVGGKLADMVKGMDPEAAIAKLRKTSDKMGANWGEITAAAKRLGRAEELSQAGLLKSAAAMLDGLVVTPPPPKPKPELKKSDGMPAPLPLGKPALWAEGDGARYRMRAAGFQVKRVRHLFKVLFGENVLHPGLPSELQAWEFAAGNTAPYSAEGPS